MIWDGDCHFCRHWVERWRAQTGVRVQYETSQSAGPRFPEIPPREFQTAVVLVLPDGEVLRGAEAVFRSLSYAPGRGWLLSAYRNVPGMAPVCDVSYRFIARHRGLASAATRLLWGNDVARPTYFITRNIFLRGLGLIYLIAFVSLWVQIDGLIGERGILPANRFFSAVAAHYGTRAIFALPSLCWFNASDAMLHALCASGVIGAIVLIAGLLPLPMLLVCFASYLSLSVAGQTFLSFQWDSLLIETGFLALFFAPARLTLTRAAPVSSIALFLLKVLLFKLMFMSGVVKLTSGDDCWWNLTALDYHYWTQPLPTPIAWFADKHPEWLKKFSVAFCLLVEIVVPFLVWAPRRLRLTAAALLVALQIAIALTGNYCFFNLLTILLCLLLFDDRAWQRLGRRPPGAQTAVARRYGVAALVALVITLPLNLWQMYSALKPQAVAPEALAALDRWVAPFEIANGYGLFRVMTKDRPEIQVEGSADGIDWVPYEFRWKPGDVRRPPGWNAPHQPRLDWQMWFAALGGARQEAWFQNFMVRLLQNEPHVTALLARNPFPDKPPRYVRAILFQYQFTSEEERRASAAWWKRHEVGEFFPEASLPR